MVGGDGCVHLGLEVLGPARPVLRLDVVTTHRRPNSALDLGVDEVSLAIDHCFPATSSHHQRTILTRPGLAVVTASEYLAFDLPACPGGR